jgi:hypothetical protein
MKGMRQKNRAKCFASRFYLIISQTNSGPGGGIGRRAGLKHLWLHGRAGSTPAPGTIKAS